VAATSSDVANDADSIWGRAPSVSKETDPATQVLALMAQCIGPAHRRISSSICPTDSRARQGCFPGNDSGTTFRDSLAPVNTTQKASLPVSDTELSHFLLALALLAVRALAGGILFAGRQCTRCWREFAAELVAWAVVLGLIAPAWQLWVFQVSKEQAVVLSALYWLGMVYVMFTAGFSITLKVGARRPACSWLALVVAARSGRLRGPAAAAPLAQAFRCGGSAAFTLSWPSPPSVTIDPVNLANFLDPRYDEEQFAQLTLVAAAIQDLVRLGNARRGNGGAARKPKSRDCPDIGGVRCGRTLAFAVASGPFLAPHFAPGRRRHQAMLASRS